MRVKYIEEFGVDGIFIFASAANKVESGISRSIREEFKTLLGDDSAKVRFNANSIRNFWERLWSIIKGNVSEGVNKAHHSQTAHSEKTKLPRSIICQRTGPGTTECRSRKFIQIVC